MKSRFLPLALGAALALPGCIEESKPPTDVTQQIQTLENQTRDWISKTVALEGVQLGVERIEWSGIPTGTKEGMTGIQFYVCINVPIRPEYFSGGKIPETITVDYVLDNKKITEPWNIMHIEFVGTSDTLKRSFFKDISSPITLSGLKEDKEHMLVFYVASPQSFMPVGQEANTEIATLEPILQMFENDSDGTLLRMIATAKKTLPNPVNEEGGK